MRVPEYYIYGYTMQIRYIFAYCRCVCECIWLVAVYCCKAMKEKKIEENERNRKQ